MKVEKLLKDYKERKFERAFEEISIKILKENNIHGKISKFADTEDSDSREIRWEILVDSSEEGEKIEDLLEDIIPFGMDVVLCGNCDGNGYVVSLVYVWYIEEVNDVLEAEKEYVSLIENTLETPVSGADDIDVLRKSYNWCNTEVIYF